MLKRKHVAMLLVLVLLFGFGASNYAMSANANSEVDSNHHVYSYIINELVSARIPNASVAVIHDGELTFVLHDSDKNDLFQIGSTGKAFTGLGILWLEDEGLISLDDPISKHLPWFTAYYDGRPVSDSLTIGSLLYMTSGISSFGQNLYGMTLEEAMRQESGSELSFYPLTQMEYSNMNYNILGHIMEVVSGKSYDAFMTEYIFIPLGLHNTFANPQKAYSSELVVRGYRWGFFGRWPSNLPAIIAEVPAGVIYSDINDMARWMQIHLGVIEVSEQFERIIRRSHEYIPESRIEIPPHVAHMFEYNPYYAAGWLRIPETGEIYHDGGTFSYTSRLFVRPQEGTAIVMLANVQTTDVSNISDNVLRLLAGEPVHPGVNNFFRTMDYVLSSIIIAAVVGIIILAWYVLRLRRKIKNGEMVRTGFSFKGGLRLIPAALLGILTMAILIFLPSVFFQSWAVLAWFFPLSLIPAVVLVATLSLTALFVSFVRSVHKKV